jgi:hypothetical protein
MKLIIAVLFLIVTTGCAKISYVNKDGEKFTYMRFGTMKLSEFEANVNKDNKVIKIGSSEGSEGDMAKSLLNLTEVSKKLSGVPIQ